jgi:hypothetical protein
LLHQPDPGQPHVSFETFWLRLPASWHVAVPTAGILSNDRGTLVATVEGSSLSIRYSWMPLPGGTHIWSHLKRPGRSQTLARHNTAGRYGRRDSRPGATPPPFELHIRIRRLTSCPKAQGRQTGTQAGPEHRSIRDPDEPGHRSGWIAEYRVTVRNRRLYTSGAMTPTTYTTPPVPPQSGHSGRVPSRARVAVSGDKPRTIRHGQHPDISVGVSCNFVSNVAYARNLSRPGHA